MSTKAVTPPASANVGAAFGNTTVTVGPLVVECKRGHALALTPWLAQASAACVGDRAHHYPAVVARADHEPSVIVLRLDHFLALLAPRRTATEVAEHAAQAPAA